jgi:hypothetical protein
VGQRTFETRSLYLILAEKLFTLPAANEMLPLSALFAGKYREVLVEVILGSAPHLPSCSRLTDNPNLTPLLPTHIIRRGPKSDRSY